MSYRSCRPTDFEAFVTRHENSLFRAALAIMGNVSDAEDILQETFLRAYEKAPEFASDKHERAWLMKVAVNLCKSKLRSPWHRRRVELTESYPASGPEQHELLEQVMALPPKYRTVIHLYYYEGYSAKDISELTGQKESTVRSHLARARQKLRSVLEEEDYEVI
ncbi:MAG TPA: sigma-70 family RNA polymerase sigma factor [Clostridiales bacterium]|nr:sigma-70 family RNA polymerase sigma factor [Clostridiales bacterium]